MLQAWQGGRHGQGWAVESALAPGLPGPALSGRAQPHLDRCSSQWEEGNRISTSLPFVSSLCVLILPLSVFLSICRTLEMKARYKEGGVRPYPEAGLDFNPTLLAPALSGGGSQPDTREVDILLFLLFRREQPQAVVSPAACP